MLFKGRRVGLVEFKFISCWFIFINWEGRPLLQAKIRWGSVASIDTWPFRSAKHTKYPNIDESFVYGMVGGGLLQDNSGYFRDGRGWVDYFLSSLLPELILHYLSLALSSIATSPNILLFCITSCGLLSSCLRLLLWTWSVVAACCCFASLSRHRVLSFWWSFDIGDKLKQVSRIPKSTNRNKLYHCLGRACKDGCHIPVYWDNHIRSKKHDKSETNRTRCLKVCMLCKP